MDRRTFGTTMLLGSLGLAAAPVAGQGRRMGQMMQMMQMGPAERRHHMDTMMVGAVALETSRLAQSRAADPMVRRFADFEVEEQTTISEILNEMMRMPPPPPPPPAADRRMMEQLASLRGRDFDRMYLQGQLSGHQRLLQIQDTYLSQGRQPHHRHIAMLARGRIREHISDVEHLQRMA